MLFRLRGSRLPRDLRPTLPNIQIVVIVMLVADRHQIGRHQIGRQLRHTNPHAVVIGVGHNHRSIFSRQAKTRMAYPFQFHGCTLLCGLFSRVCARRAGGSANGRR